MPPPTAGSTVSISEPSASAAKLSPGARLELVAWSLAAVRLLAAPLLTPAWLPLDAGAWHGPWRTGPGLVLAALLALRLVRLHAPASRLLRARLGILLALIGLEILYTGNGAVITAGDNAPNRQLASAILRHGDLDLGAELAPRGGELPYYLVRVGQRVLPSFPLGTGLMTLPYAAIARALTHKEPSPDLLLRWEKHAATLMALGAVALFFVALRRREPAFTAVAATLTFALATQVVSTASQALWSLTGELLLVCGALGEVLRPQPRRWGLVAAGLAMGGAFLCRPSAVLLVGAIAALLFWGAPGPLDRRERAGAAALFVVSTSVATGLAAAWLFTVYGHPLGGYGLLNLQNESWARSEGAGILGTLLSPSRGLLPYAPWLLVAFVVLLRGDRTDRRLLAIGGTTTLAISVLAGSYSKWWGGHSLGPRLLTEAAPFLALLTVPLWRRWRDLGRGLRIAFLALLAFSVVLQVAGIYNRRSRDWSYDVDVDNRPGVLWSLRDSQIAATLVPGWRPSPEARRSDTPAPRAERRHPRRPAAPDSRPMGGLAAPLVP